MAIHYKENAENQQIIFYFNLPVSVKPSASPRIIWTAGISMRSILPLTGVRTAMTNEEPFTRKPFRKRPERALPKAAAVSWLHRCMADESAYLCRVVKNRKNHDKTADHSFQSSFFPDTGQTRSPHRVCPSHIIPVTGKHIKWIMLFSLCFNNVISSHSIVYFLLFTVCYPFAAF